MIQKPVKLRRITNGRGAMLIEEPASAISRPTLFSTLSKERLATESFRAKQPSLLTNPKKKYCRDFAASFQFGSIKDRHLIYATSHSSAVPVCKPKLMVLPTFPMVQSLRWNPYVESSTIDDSQSSSETVRRVNCKCSKNCVQSCPSKVRSSTTLKSGSRKSNIMTFCDNYTMTPKLTEAACGCSSVPSTRSSEVSVRASEIAVRSTRANVNVNQVCNQPKCLAMPTPILKKNSKIFCKCHGYKSNHDIYKTKGFCSYEYDQTEDLNQKPEKDISAGYCKPTKVSSIKSFLKCCTQKNEPAFPRKIIYNEGISDLIAHQFPETTIGNRSITNTRNCSKESLKCPREAQQLCSEDNSQLPYSHKSSSKYHRSCKSSGTKISYYDSNDEVRHIVVSPEIVRKTTCCKPSTHYRIPIIRLPKKVLTSDRDIESYVEQCYLKTNVAACGRRRR